MTDSILTSTKKMLGLADEDTSFDLDIVMFINMAFAQLNDLGIGPATGFRIHDNSATWTQLLGDNQLFEDVKTYVYMSVRLIFDPPTTSFGITAMEKQIEKHGWLMNVRREGQIWTPTPVAPEEVVLDGGDP